VVKALRLKAVIGLGRDVQRGARGTHIAIVEIANIFVPKLFPSQAFYEPLIKLKVGF
jgi:hypothetical protein